MSIKLTKQDLTALPSALLTVAKQHMRLDGTYDDSFVQIVIARAIGRFEQTHGVALNPATFEWTPGQFDFSDGSARVPVTPVSAFVAKLADTTDVSADYTITTDSVFGVPILYLNGAYQSGVVLTLTAGFAVLPPPVLDVVLRNTAHLYEHREILMPPQRGVPVPAPDLAMDATWWVPRA